MAKITATAWTESVEDRAIEGKHRRNRVKLTLSSTQALTYASGGIPLPTTMGMVRNIDYVIMIQQLTPASSASGGAKKVLWDYTVSSHIIRGYYAENPTVAGGPSHFPELATTWKVSDLGTSPVMYVEAVGW